MRLRSLLRLSPLRFLLVLLVLALFAGDSFGRCFQVDGRRPLPGRLFHPRRPAVPIQPAPVIVHPPDAAPVYSIQPVPGYCPGDCPTCPGCPSCPGGRCPVRR